MAGTDPSRDEAQRETKRVSEPAELAAAAHARRLSLATLLDLSRELTGVLIAVQPRAAFRADLYSRLLVEARRQQAVRTLSLPDRSDFDLDESWVVVRRSYLGYGTGGRRWLLGAAAVGSAASVVGLLAFVRSRRHGRAA
jgi:hypothetical protein